MRTLAAAALGLSLASCAASLPPITSTTPSGVIISDAVSLAGRFCQIAPTAGSIVNIFVSNPILTTAEELARAFCQAIMPKPSLTAAARPLVRGMMISGSYRGKPIAGTVK